MRVKDNSEQAQDMEEYDFSQGVRGKYASRYANGTKAVKETATPVEPEARWRSRMISYHAGDWDKVVSLLPSFTLAPFTAGEGKPANPFLQAVMREPTDPSKARIPVGVVGRSYTLVQHLDAAQLCHEAVTTACCNSNSLRYEVGLSELGEWMNLRIYFPESYQHKDSHNEAADLRLECFNSVDGSSSLTILFGWFRIICANGLVIGETKMKFHERHGQNLTLSAAAHHIGSALESVEKGRKQIQAWETEAIAIETIARWADNYVSDKWGKKAATRVFHICASGTDVEMANLFEGGTPTERNIRVLHRVPGSPRRAKNKYDVSQALSFIASRRNNPEERLAWQETIPSLIEHL